MNKLLNINLPEQRSKDWYIMRHNMITASDLYKVLGPPGNRRELLIKKSSPIDTNKQKGVAVEMPVNMVLSLNL